ncbi:PEP/pyruvate-binding domain-containing protein [Chitinophaga ginsengisoli]|uniref:Phosphoenolpyruvate synthase n=1 Tax=Chitinophaga ginsengisoli TaxID=363837 RepID=A0A2P8GL39_9BACT|nr:PEP/pyruvate-binding domain-containing protein [Chitinophaga ginsengisoli]PSL34665.1 pyruvate phosphate dikinase-like enzyme [Chitinophaga ginsengisoli]
MEALVKSFSEISMQDVATVGGKSASMGEIMKHLSPQGINIPDGFATTAFSYWTFQDFNNLWEPLEKLMEGLDRHQFSNLKETGAAARALILRAEMPDFIAKAIKDEYSRLWKADRGTDCWL